MMISLLLSAVFISQIPVALTIDLVEYTTGSTILCIGDSLTHGLYVSQDDESGQSSHPYAIQLTKSLKSASTVIEEGTNGATLSEMLNQLPSLIKKHNPLMVIILGGTNDLGHGGGNATHDRILNNLIQLHKQALSHTRSDKKKVVTVGVTIPPADGHDEEQESTRLKVNTGILKLPKHHHRTYICDLAAQTQFSFPNKYSPFWSSDGLHLSATGYDVLGKLIFNTMLESKLSEKAPTATNQ